MIKLKQIIKEDFPIPILDKIIEWKNKLIIGQLIVKEMGRASQFDELYQYLGESKKTDDYSLSGEAQISAKLSKIGLILFDHQFGLVINLFSDHPLLIHKLIKIDANWRHLGPEELKVLQKELEIHPEYNVELGSNAGKLRKETYKQIIEKHNGVRIKI